VNELTGGQYVVDFLASQGVDTVFCITGAGNLAIIDAFSNAPQIRIVFSHHEQAAVMEAIGYSKISGKPGVALVTTGGGSSNVVTGVLSAQLDSVPVLLISGNESSFHCENMHDFRAYGVQGFDSVAVLSPITKVSSRVMNGEDLSAVLAKSWAEMISGRQGAVHVDIPMDIQRKKIGNPELAEPVKRREILDSAKSETDELSAALKKAKRPIFYIGNGLRSSRVTPLLDELWRKTKTPFFLSWSALDFVPEDHAGNFGRLGIYGDRYANLALQKADLVVCLGTRLAIPQVGYDRNDFGRLAKKWVIDCDETELTKFDGSDWHTVLADATKFLEQLLKDLNSSNEMVDTLDWLRDLAQIKKELPRVEQVGPRPQSSSGFVHSVDVMSYLNEALDSTAIIGTDVGAALLSGHYALELKEGQNLFTSQGLGEMGFGLPGTIGSYFADPSRQLVCLNTDGAIMFNLQELQLIAQEKIPMKLFIFNNDGYSMIKISQENLFDGRYQGSTPSSGVSFPSFEKLASLFGLNYTRVSKISDFESGIKSALKSEGPELIEIIMDPDQKYLPRLGTSKLPDGTLVSPPIEDLEPKIEIEVLERLLGYKAHRNSYTARGLTYDE
jgi:acetolactate synthase-1/2/3 large subunit